MALSTGATNQKSGVTACFAPLCLPAASVPGVPMRTAAMPAAEINPRRNASNAPAPDANGNRACGILAKLPPDQAGQDRETHFEDARLHSDIQSAAGNINWIREHAFQGSEDSRIGQNRTRELQSDGDRPEAAPTENQRACATWCDANRPRRAPPPPSFRARAQARSAYRIASWDILPKRCGEPISSSISVVTRV